MLSTVKEQLFAFLILCVVFFLGYKLHQAYTPTREVKTTHIVTEENQKKQTTTQDSAQREESKVVAVSTDQRKATERTVVTTTRKYDPTTSNVTEEIVVEEKTREVEEVSKDRVVESQSTENTQHTESTTVETAVKIEDKKVDATTTVDNNSSLNVKIIATAPEPDVGVAVELVKVPVDTPLVGGIAGNVYGTVVHPSVGIAVTVPVVRNIEVLAGLGVDLTQTQKLTTRGVVGVGLKLSF